ncbi:MAG TPA: AMP-binding protein, partial [Candidatus Polarisedimenticolia bacterium]|nr:AMP-binding protein [Candidatus Polarisedimenticolia bacterium]
LAYLFYTSGSTGRAKGIADTHRNVLHNVMRYTNNLHIGVNDRLTLIQTAGFSGAVSSLYCALLNGATSYPFSLKEEGPARLCDWAAGEKLTMFHAVPSIFRLLARGGHGYPDLRIIRLEGDRATPSDIALFKERFSENCTLVNGLGATECGIVRQFFVTKYTPVPESVVPIGHAIEDMDVLLLDEGGAPVPPGTAGEISIRSRYLAPGYWKRPDLTAAAFTADPADPGLRTYRTGDVGRMSADGCLDYLGRQKFQIRIRGTWIDTAEIETVLRKLNLFSDLVVHAPDEGRADPRLVAYLVAKEGTKPRTDGLRAQLSIHLPPSLIPLAFVFLDRLPLNSFGKVDRSALPAPSRSRPSLDTPFVEPEGAVRRRLQAIWQDVLTVRPVGAQDNFFDLGGDSFHALAMSLEVEQAFGRRITPELMLAAPTIEGLARFIEAATPNKSSPVIEVQKGNGKRPFYFLHGDYDRGGYYCLPLARQLGIDRPFFALPPAGVNGAPVPANLSAIAAEHVSALRRHQPHGPYLLGGNCIGGLVAYEMARLLHAEGERVETLVLFASSVLNLRLWPLRWALAPVRLVHRRMADDIFARLQPLLIGFVMTPRAQRPRRILRRLAREWHRRLRPVLVARDPGPSTTRSTPVATEKPTSPIASSCGIEAIYQQAKRQYWPSRYSGTVTLFWWESEGEGVEEAARLWGRIAGRVALHRMPIGTHHELSSGDVCVVGDALKLLLE